MTPNQQTKRGKPVDLRDLNIMLVKQLGPGPTDGNLRQVGESLNESLFIGFTCLWWHSNQSRCHVGYQPKYLHKKIKELGLDQHE